jgi:hypothetical protein
MAYRSASPTLDNEADHDPSSFKDRFVQRAQTMPEPVPLSDDSSTNRNMRRSASEEFAIDSIWPSSPAHDRAVDTVWPEHGTKTASMLCHEAESPSPPSKAPANIVHMLLSKPLGVDLKVRGDIRQLPKLAELNLEGEANKLRQALREAAYAKDVDVELKVGIATVKALQSAMTLGARVVHIAGHGHEKFMMFEDGHGGARALEPQALQRLVSAGAGRRHTCRLVVLNSCSSEANGRALVAAGVEHVVAVAQDQNNGKISDHAGIAFCQAFYRSLANMDSVRKAFDMGCAAARKEMRGEVGSDGQFILLPEDEDHDERIFSPIPGSFRETTRPPPPSNAPPPPTFYVGRTSDQCVCVESMLRHRLTTIGGGYGSGKSALAMAAADYASQHRRFDAVVWVNVTTADRFFDDVAEAAKYVIQKAEDDHLNPMNKKMMHIKKRSTSIDTADTSALDTSILVDLASAGRVLVVLNDFENLVLNGFGGQGVAAAQIAARERCRLLLRALLESCSNISVLMTCSSGSGIGLVPGVTEQVVALGPMTPSDTAYLLLQRNPELKRRATDPFKRQSPRIAPPSVVVAYAAHPFVKRLNGLPFAVSLAVLIINKLFASEEAAKAACEAAGAHKTLPPSSKLEPLDRALRVLDEPKLFDPDLRRLREELNHVVLHGRRYRPDGAPASPTSPTSPVSPWAPPPEFQLDAPMSPSTVASPSTPAVPSAPASPWALGPSVEPRRLAFALLAVWGVRLAADAAERGALDALVLNVRLDAVVHLVLDVLAVALLYEARR